jgi:hypothetical protein
MDAHEIETKVIMDVGFSKIKIGSMYGLMGGCMDGGWVDE